MDGKYSTHAAIGEKSGASDDGRERMRTRIRTNDGRKRDLARVLSLLPAGLRREIEGVLASRRGAGQRAEEIRLRVGGMCSVVVGGVSLPLVSGIDRSGADELVLALCHGSLYAYRDTITRGYIPMDDGARVGICGSAKYDGGEIVGVGEIGSLVFRFPQGECSFADELYDVWCTARSGLLIISPPCGGKTTALRTLVGLVGGRGGRRVVAIDERCELRAEDYAAASVDLVRGYDRRLGIELALRTMSPQVIAVDEIGNDGDSEALMAVAGAGVSVIATAHGEGIADAIRRESISRLVLGGLMDTFVSIERRGSEFLLHREYMTDTVERMGDDRPACEPLVV